MSEAGHMQHRHVEAKLKPIDYHCACRLRGGVCNNGTLGDSARGIWERESQFVSVVLPIPSLRRPVSCCRQASPIQEQQNCLSLSAESPGTDMGAYDYSSSRSWIQQRKLLLCSIGAVFILALFFLGSVSDTHEDPSKPSWLKLCSLNSGIQHQQNVRHIQAADAQEAFAAHNRSTKLHVLLPASNPEVNLCKTLLTSKVLGYETPTLIAWNQKFDTRMTTPSTYSHQG